MKTDILIIGGGPGGLCAAYESACLGLKVAIVDESFYMGGQLKQQPQKLDLPSYIDNQSGFELINYLVKRLVGYDVQFLSQCTMTGTYEDGRIGVTDGKTTFPIAYKKAIISTGASENPIAFPGWTLPGVMTIGAAQILLNREKVLPGEKAIILGYNNFSVEIIKQLYQKGIEISAVVDKNSELKDISNDDKKELEEMEIPIFYETTAVYARGSEEVKAFFIEHQNNKIKFDVNLICVSSGLSPVLEALQILGCELVYQEKLGGWVPSYNESFKTSVPNIYVAGNAAGITTIKSIMLTGHIAGINAVRNLGVERLSYNIEREKLLREELLIAENDTEVGVERAEIFKKSKLQKTKDTSTKKGGTLIGFINNHMQV